MMSVADKKRRFLSEMDHIPSSELSLWAGYYELRNEQLEKERKMAAMSANLNSGGRR